MHFLARSALVLAIGMASASAAQAQQINIRGVIAGVEGDVIAVRTREGDDVKIDVPKDTRISTTKPFSLADIKPGMMLGVTTVRRADGATVAIDVRPIPPTANRGLSPHDLQPESTMTNAVIEAVVVDAGTQELSLNYGTGPVRVLVLPTTALSQAVPGTNDDIKAGETVFAAVRRGDNGRFTALRVQVSKDGVKPTQ